MLRLALLELAPLLVGVHVADDPVALGVLGDRLEPARGDRTDAVRGNAHFDPGPRRRPLAQTIHALEERLDVRVAEAPLARSRREVPVVPATAVVGGRKHHDRQSGLDGRLDDGVRHRVRLEVRRAVGLVVDVMKFADNRIARPAHLVVRLECRRAHPFRV